LRLVHAAITARHSGQGARGVQVDPHALGREREERVLALELCLGLLSGPQRLDIGTASLLLFLEAQLGIEVFFYHSYHLLQW
jgi:hypothetical protein